MDCTGCGKRLGTIEAIHWNVCMECTRARAATVARHGRCACGREARPRAVKALGREWRACDRCLGTIRQPR